MEKTKALLLLLLLAVSVRTSWADDAAEEAKDAAQGVAEKAESWADWAYDKYVPVIFSSNISSLFEL